MTINVTAKEFKFVMSKRSVPKGTTVIFKIKNTGVIEHDFKIAGKKTKLLKHNQTATLKVVFKKKGKFGYTCTVKGHAALGMKGTFGVGVTPPKVTTTATTVTTTTATTTTGTTTTTPVTCTTPTSTVNVSMKEYTFTVNGVIGGGTTPAGCVQFNIKNDGQVVHNFNIIGIKAGALISNGASETWNVQLTAGNRNYTCDVPFHDSFGMNGTLTVT